MLAAASKPNTVGGFLRAGAGRHREWVLLRRTQLVWFCLAAVVVGAGTYGAVMGCWRSPLQAFYTGIKLPLVILLTTLSNGLLNGMLAPLLGLNTTFRQSFVIVLMSFAIASVILGALSPVALFLVWNTPPLTAATVSTSVEYGFMQLMLALFVAIAGTIGNVRLVPMLFEWTGSARIARNVLFAWLAVNLFLGSQICWVLRPFIWGQTDQVTFIGQNSFQGSFFETVFDAMRRLLVS